VKRVTQCAAYAQYVINHVLMQRVGHLVAQPPPAELLEMPVLCGIRSEAVFRSVLIGGVAGLPVASASTLSLKR
jgi:hypothetical protein